MRYRGSTVPVMTLDGTRVSGTMKIARALEALEPDPPMFAERSRATRRGPTRVLQDGVRQLARWAIGQGRARRWRASSAGSHPARTSSSAPCPVLRPVVACQMRPSRAPPEACLEALPGQLDRVDALLEEGVIGGEQPNVVDFQVAPSVRLMLCFDQLREHIDARPAGAHARALVPDYPGRFRAVFPD